MSPSAMVTGITGQDGSYLAELLLEKGYEVHGLVRRSSTERSDRIEHLRGQITLHQGDLLDQRSLVDALRASQPDEIYNLAAMSYVATSWVQPTLTAEFTGVGVTRILEAMWLMLQRDEPDDYVIATGSAHSVRECLSIAFDQAGIEIDEHVVIDPSLVRPAEVDHLIGDCSKATRDLGWRPTTDFETLIRMMVDADRELLSR